MWACRAAMSSLVGGFSLYLIDLWTSYVVEATTNRPAPVRIICRGWIDLPNNFIVLSPQTSCQILGNSDFGEFVEGLAVADESSGVEWDQQIFGAQWPSDYQEVWTLYRSHELYLFYLATLISVVGF